MKTISKLTIALCALLLIAAVVMLAFVGIPGKAAKGGVAVRVDMGATYDALAIADALKNSGFSNPVTLATSRTAFEIEADAMDAAALETAANALLSALQATYPDAKLVYAESFGASSGIALTAGSIWAAVGFAVLAFAFGWIRFGWRAGLAAVCSSFAAAILTGGICVLLSGVIGIGTALLGILAGVMLLTYVYALYVYERVKENASYAVSNADLAAPILAIVACVLVFVSGGATVMKLMFAGVLGSLIAALCMKLIAPAFRADFAKQAR